MIDISSISPFFSRKLTSRIGYFEISPPKLNLETPIFHLIKNYEIPIIYTIQHDMSKEINTQHHFTRLQRTANI